MKFRHLALVAAPVALLAACSGGSDGDDNGEGGDAASDAALNGDLATDPDLAGDNEAGAALSGTGNQGVPNVDTSQRAVEAARDRAAELVGGRENLNNTPPATRIAGTDTVTKPMQEAAKRIGQNAACLKGSAIHPPGRPSCRVNSRSIRAAIRWRLPGMTRAAARSARSVSRHRFLSAMSSHSIPRAPAMPDTAWIIPWSARKMC